MSDTSIEERLHNRIANLEAERDRSRKALKRAREVIVTYVAPDARDIIAEIDAALAISSESAWADRLDAYVDQMRDEAEDELSAARITELEAEIKADLEGSTLSEAYAYRSEDHGPGKKT